jgi:phosphomannomutase
MSIFRAYDIRGVYGKDLTNEIALKIGKALGTFLKGKEKVCVGFDTRPSSPVLFENLVAGLVSTGCDVISLGMVPGPVAYFFAWKNEIFGCYISASHNPVEWNGIKIFKPNGVSFTKEIKILQDILYSKKFLKGKGSLKEEKNAIKNYTLFLKNKIGKLEGRIVTDFLGGAGVAFINSFREIGLEIITLHDKPDPSLYGFHRLEPWGNLLNKAKEMVKREKADFGVAFDCDADRAVFISPSGKYVDASVMNGIFIEHILKRKKGKIIATYDCASELEKFVKKLNGNFLWCRVGHSFIEEKCVEENALFAGEQSSHFYFNEFYPFSDGFLSTLYLAKILNETGKKFNELVKRIKFRPVEKIYINVGSDEKKLKIIEELRKDFPEATDIIDGIKIKLNEIEWVLIRASQTLPEINICAEGKNKKRLKEIVEKYSKIVKEKL